MTDVGLLLVVLLVVVVVWRGPKTLPQIGKMLGRGVKATREEVKSIQSDSADKPADDETPKTGA